MTALIRSLSMNNPGFAAYSPTLSSSGGGVAIGAGGTVLAQYRRVGDSIELFCRVTFGVGGGGGAGNYRVSIPTGLTRDATKVLSTSDFVPGHAFALDASAHANDVQCYITIAGGTDVMEFFPTRGTGAAISAAYPFVWTNADVINIGACVPITGY